MMTFIIIDYFQGGPPYSLTLPLLLYAYTRCFRDDNDA